MELYIQPNDWMVIGVGILCIVALLTYVYYTLMDREDSHVSKEELGYVIVCTLLASAVAGAMVYIVMLLRLQNMFPPVDDVDMGEPPF